MTSSWIPYRPILHPSDMQFPRLGPEDLASPRLWHPPEVSVLPDARSFLGIAYARPLGWRPLLLDLHLPLSPAGPMPVVAYAHGGSMVGGVRQMGPWASLLGHGIAVATLDYRLAGEARYPEPIEDLRAGLQWLSAHGAGYGLDPERVVAWGSSAGGYLMARAALSSDTPVGRPVGTDRGFDISALVLHYAPIDFATLIEDAFEPTPEFEASVIDVVSQFFGFPMSQDLDAVEGASVLNAIGSASAVPPTYMSHGDSDRRCGISQSRRLHETLNSRGVPSVLDAVQGADHAADIFASSTVIDPTVEFLRRTWAVSAPDAS